MKRACGVLLHVTSLPSGNFAGATKFVDFLVDSGAKYWQVLPLNPTDCESPYSPTSVFAGNPKLLDKAQIHDYTDDQVKEFTKDNKYWLDGYVSYVSKKEKRESTEIIKEQMQFFEQWGAIKKYANNKGIEIIGDIPIYTAMDSADVETWPEQFDFENGKPTGVAGVPPDYFNEDGQHWGNPLYNFKQMSRDKYKWWIARVKQMQKMFDILRIDHFRAFDTYYKIPYGAKNARVGEWCKGPGIKIFNALKLAVPRVKIILEDLGDLAKSVHKLRDATGLPGMRVMQFGFDGNKTNEHLPANYPKNCVAYIGTHDNDTMMGFLQSCDEDTRKSIDAYLSSEGLRPKDVTRLAMEDIMASKADTVVLCMQDLLYQGTKERMNIPGNPFGNWKYKIKESDLNEKVSAYLKMLTEKSNR